ncbi:MAG: glycoside hydrolase family 3 N-terminal domain-containing protein [Planctomycetaceae bacterium]
MSAERLLLPSLRFAEAGRDLSPFLRLAERGVGGFVLFGGGPGLGAMVEQLRAAAPHPLLFASDLEDGAGQQIEGETRHPPAAALGPGAAEAAGRLTALEARRHGITMTFAPVCDVASEPRNPILSQRAFQDPVSAAPRFTKGARAGGLRTCAKHFPGHGATTEDSHTHLPVVRADARLWRARDLAPFRACIEHGVDAVMTAHVACPELTGEGLLPATLSRRVMTTLLRDEMGFSGLLVSDALLMEGVRGGRSEAEAALLALEAGCDAVLCPEDVEGVLAALREVRPRRLEEALARVAVASHPLPAGVESDAASLREELRRAAVASVRRWGELPLGAGRHPLLFAELHGGGEAIAAAWGGAYRRLGLDGAILDEGGRGGLAAPVFLCARRDKAWGGPLDCPPALRRIGEGARAVVALGPARLLEGWTTACGIHAPGEDPSTLREVFRALLGR